MKQVVFAFFFCFFLMFFCSSVFSNGKSLDSKTPLVSKMIPINIGDLLIDLDVVVIH